jgi:hypothetical protein
MAGKDPKQGLDLLRGDTKIARFMFGSGRMRGSVKTLMDDGWPIFEVAGKRTARPLRLTEEAEKRERAAVKRDK